MIETTNLLRTPSQTLKANSGGSNIKKILNEIRKYQDKEIFSKNYEQLTVFLGNSGTGKSTLLNFMMGCDLLVKEVKPKVIIKNLSNFGAEIGHGSTSKTYLPGIYPKDGINYCDMPGFRDSRGLIKEVTKSFMMKEVIEHTKNIRFIIVISHSSLEDRGALLKNSIDALIKLIPSINEDEKIIQSMLIAVTIVDIDLMEDSEEEVIDEIHGQFQKIASTAAESNHKYFLKSIQKEQIVIFRKPRRKDKGKKLIDIKNDKSINVFKESHKRIHQKLPQLAFLDRKKMDIKISVVDGAINELIKEASSLTKSMLNELKFILDLIGNYHNECIQTTNDIHQLKTILDPNNWSTLESKKDEWPDFLAQLKKELADKAQFAPTHVYLKELLLQDNLLQFLKEIDAEGIIVPFTEYKNLFNTFLESLKTKLQWNETLIQLSQLPISQENINILEKYKKNKSKKLDEKLQDIAEKQNIDLASLENSQKKELDGILQSMTVNQVVIKDNKTAIIHGYLVDLQREINKLKSFKNIWVLGGRAIIFNQVDLKAHSTNLSLIAPEMLVLGGNKINLSGTSGPNPTKPKANNGTTKGSNGSDGVPGQPGISAGHFMAIGFKVVNDEALTVNLDGGKGGNGQDGGNGIKGHDGLEAKGYPEDFKMKVSKVADPPRQYDRHLRIIYGTLGKKGGDGGMGGKGGTSGYSGEVFLHPTDNFKISQKKVNGADGISGSPGRGGTSGNDKVQIGKLLYSDRTIVGIQWEKTTRSKRPHNPPFANDGNLPYQKNSKGIKSPKTIPMISYQPLVKYKELNYYLLDNKYFKQPTALFLQLLKDIQEGKEPS